METCDECGERYEDGARGALADDLRAGAAAIAHELRSRSDADLRRRPAPDVWSPLEYGCHVRDVLIVQRERLGRALVEDAPRYEPMGRDERVVTLRYDEQDPVVVAGEVVAAGEALAAAFEDLDDGAWDRTGSYTYPTRQLRTMEWLARHTRHELHHHLGDLCR